MAATLEPAQAGDLEISYAIIDQGREFQKEQNLHYLQEAFYLK